MECLEATAVSHTGDWIRDFAKVTIDKIGAWRFCAVVADSTGNTLLARRLLVRNVIRTALKLGDVVHHLNRAIGDIAKIAAFRPVPIQVVRNTITIFHKSHAGHAALKAARKERGIGRGIQAIGKTRFATLTLAAASVKENAPAIRDVIKADSGGAFDAIAASYRSQSSRASFQFENGLSQFLHVSLPLAKAIACLEALDSTAADVYLFWHAILRSVEDVLDNELDLDFTPDVIEEVRGILNARYRQLFKDGNIANDIYLAATYLNPSECSLDSI
ncbi:hypothetical protein FA95DRAFT_1506654 [Auriscalpium vulgare]|uniref:Uncharacterized protein n=1 Tax=Auriscalpium vulgare TaxID=40419 RepID=A0ACB8R0P7_9AGAM|nr:hypothetical protein FA95DRAFT_1506654 [Auriscalpium vulgare]